MCIPDSEKSALAGTSSQPPLGVETRCEVDHFDGNVVQSEQSRPSNNKDGDDERSNDKDRTHFRGNDSEKGRDQIPTPTYDRSPQITALPSDDKVERSSRGDTAGGQKDGEKQRTRRQEHRSWADQTEADQKAYSTFESEFDGDRSSRKDEGRGASQYLRQDRRKSQTSLSYCFIFAELHYCVYYY